jgi:hypothetical protein
MNCATYTRDHTTIKAKQSKEKEKIQKKKKKRNRHAREKREKKVVRGVRSPLFRETPPTTSGGERRVVVHDADAQDLFGADQHQIFRLVRHGVEAQVVRFLEVQRGVRARDAPARVAHASDDAVEVAREEDGHLCVGLVHLDPQDTGLVATTLSNSVTMTNQKDRTMKFEKDEKKKNERAIKGGKKKTLLLMPHA